MSPPLAPTLLTPTAYSNIPSSGATFTWQFNAASGSPSQTSADLQYRVYGTTTWTVVTGAASTGTSWSETSAFTAGSTYEWQVRTTGAGGTGPYSASSFVLCTAAIPAPTITSPASGSTPAATPMTVTWTLPAGYAQTAYETRRTDSTAGTTVYYDSGTVTGTALTAQVPLDAVARTDHLQVRFLSSGTWSTWADITINLSLNPPPAPTLTAVCNPALANVTIVITNPAPGGGQGPAISNDLFRTDPAGNSIRIATGLPVNATYIDPYPGAGVNVYYAAAYTFAGVQAGGTLDHLGTETSTLDGVGVLYATLANVR